MSKIIRAVAKNMYRPERTVKSGRPPVTQIITHHRRMAYVRQALKTLRTKVMDLGSSHTPTDILKELDPYFVEHMEALFSQVDRTGTLMTLTESRGFAYISSNGITTVGDMYKGEDGKLVDWVGPFSTYRPDMPFLGDYRYPLCFAASLRIGSPAERYNVPNGQFFTVLPSRWTRKPTSVYISETTDIMPTNVLVAFHNSYFYFSPVTTDVYIAVVLRPEVSDFTWYMNNEIELLNLKVLYAYAKGFAKILRKSENSTFLD